MRIAIVSSYAEGQEAQLAADVVSSYAGVVLICWEHGRIPSLASSLPTVPGTVSPQAWPREVPEFVEGGELRGGAGDPPHQPPRSPGTVRMPPRQLEHGRNGRGTDQVKVKFYLR
jgi:hypothetical protein